MATIVDYVANAMPWAGGLIPATMTFRNVQTNLGFQPAEALIVGAVVEGIGFVAITTALDLYEQDQAAILETRMTSWDQPHGLSVQFWVAVAGSVLYLVAVLGVNAILDGGDLWRKLTLALLSTFGLLGGVLVALRNQLTKQRALAEEREAERKALAARQEQDADNERTRLQTLQIQRDQDALEHKRQMQAEELRQQHELKLERQRATNERKLRKLEKVSEQPSETFQKVSEPAQELPPTYGKWKDWRKLPESEKKLIATFERPEQVSELYGVSLKTGGNWLKNAKEMEVTA